MAKTVADVMNMVKEGEVKFVDFRFTDTRGKEQHVSVPISAFDEDKFTGGHAFDGSSIAGWKGIEASDMLLMPDPEHGQHRSVLRRADADPHLRRPRAGRRQALRARSALARQARRGVHEGVGPRRCGLLRPRARVLRLRQRPLERRHVGLFCKIESEEAAWNSGKEYEHGNSGYRPTVKGGYFPTPPVDSFQDLRSEMCLILESLGIPVEVHHHEVGTAGADGARHQVLDPGRARRLAAAAEVRDPERRALVRQDGDLHAQADRRRQRLRHARAPVGLEGRQEPVRRRRLRGPLGVRALLHRRHHQARARAERDHQPGHQQLQAARARLRGAGQARLQLAQSLGIGPDPVRRQPEGTAHRGRASRIRRPTPISPSRRC